MTKLILMFHLRILIYRYNSEKMDFNIQIRKKQLLNLEQFILTSKGKVDSILNTLGWNPEEVVKDRGLVNCPLNVHHTLPEKSITNHTEKCYLKREGYLISENFLSEPLHDPQSSIYIENPEKMAIINQASQVIPSFRRAWNGKDRDPKTCDRLMSTFSSDERVVLYDYVKSRTKGPVPPPEFNIIDPKEPTENKVLTEEERLIRERNAKRRRIKYKAVHTNKKTYKEVLKNVIDGQMELYKEWLEESDPSCKRETTERPKSSEELEGNSQNNSVISEGAIYDYPCDNSLTSRGSNHSESSKSWKRYRTKSRDRDDYKRSKERREKLNSREGSYESRISRDERKHEKKYHKDFNRDKYRRYDKSRSRRSRSRSRSNYRSRSRSRSRRYNNYRDRRH